LGGFALALLLLFIYNGLLVRGLFTFANASFSVTDGGTPAEVEQPASTLRSGSPASLVSWESLRYRGREFVGTGPTLDEVSAFHGGEALEPIRVYAGLGSADSLQERADLVLEELKRTGAFDREALLMATTTGTGWLDPNAIETLEYLLAGDTAIVGVQYSYFPSWLSLLADQAVVKATSRTVPQRHSRDASPGPVGEHDWGTEGLRTHRGAPILLPCRRRYVRFVGSPVGMPHQ
jgi:uncharacterized membrane protein